MLRRLAIFLLVLVALGGLIFSLFGDEIAKRLMRVAAERTMSTDPLQAFPDGLHVVLCGAGGPLADPVRSGPCVAVIAGRRLFVVDAGTGGGRNMGPMGIPLGQIEAVFLTHYHSDHIDGLGELALLAWVQGTRTSPLPVFGPTGVDAVVEGFNHAYAADAQYRVAHHGAKTVPPDGAGMEARRFVAPRPGTGEVVYKAIDVQVTAFRVDHTPVDPAVGYLFEYGGRRVVISGDTRRTDEVQRMAKDADLLVHEALAPNLVGIMHEAAVAAGRENLAKITADIPDYHTSPAEAAQIAQAAGVRHLLFYHVVPPLLVPGMSAAFLEGVDRAFDGGVTLGRDGTRISLPTGSEAIEVSD